MGRGPVWWSRKTRHRCHEAMPRVLYCRFCLYQAEMWIGLLPERCAQCQREALWATEPPEKALASAYEFSMGDRVFLKALRIGPDPHE